MERYQRQIILKEVGQQGQNKLLNAKVLVVGAGGLGSPVLFYLAAAGIGTIAIADFDNVSLHNLQRQILFHQNQMNQNKAIAASANLTLLNPDTQLIIYEDGIHLQNFKEIIPLYDIIVDGSDNFTTKYLVNDACYVFEKPLVYGAIFQWEGQFSVLNYPLHEGFSANLRDLFPYPPTEKDSPSCSTAGIIGPVAGVIGSFMANEVIKIILGLHEQIPYNHIISLNLLTLEYKKIRFHPNPSNPLTKNWNFENYDYEFLCQKEIFPQEFTLNLEKFEQIKNSGQPYLLVDVREEYEHAEKNLGGINVPMGKLNTNELDPNIPIIFYCNSGERSKFCALQWQKKGFKTYNLVTN